MSEKIITNQLEDTIRKLKKCINEPNKDFNTYDNMDYCIAAWYTLAEILAYIDAEVFLKCYNDGEKYIDEAYKIVWEWKNSLKSKNGKFN